MSTLIGTWKLIHWTVEMEGGRVIRPFKGKASGLLTYTDEGRMVASLMKTDRESIGTRSFAEAKALERASAAAGYLSYAGSYEVVDDQVFHKVELSLFPDWVGGTQVRQITWLTNEDGSIDLELSTPHAPDERSAVNRLRWHRITEDRS